MDEGNIKTPNGPISVTRSSKFTKHQWIIRKTRINSNGLNTAAYLSGIGLQAIDTGIDMNSLTIRMKAVPLGFQFTGKGTGKTLYENGLTTVFSATKVKIDAGYNYIIFNSSFIWDDSSDIVLEFCKESSGTSRGAIALGYAFLTSSDSLDMYSYNNFNSVCKKKDEPRPFTMAYNLHFLWDSLNVPPIANFETSNLVSCNPFFEFFDASKRGATTYFWDFGDGTTDTVPVTSHTYSRNGSYKVKLKVSNAFGSDSIIKEITYDSTQTAKSTCMGSLQNGSLPVGIKSVEFGGVFNQSDNAQREGNADFSCMQAKLKEGESFLLKFDTYQGGTHHCKIWLDKNNDGVFDAASEVIYNTFFSSSFSDNIQIPGNVILNKAIRLRIALSRNSLTTDPCQKIVEGQFEDYSIIVDSNFKDPVAVPLLFSQETCSGLYHFNHKSKGHTSMVTWNFGDGNSSNLNNPSHVYSVEGRYWVSLKVEGYGGKISKDSIAVIVSKPFNTPIVNCIPKSTSPSNVYGINKSSFTKKVNQNGIWKDSTVFSKSTVVSSAGYADYTCESQIVTKENESLGVGMYGSQERMDYYFWIDLDQSGTFTSNEMIGVKRNVKNRGGFTLNFLGIKTNTPLRLRLGAFKVGAIADVCGKSNEGELEDYTLYFEPYSTYLPDTVKPKSIMKSGAHFFCKDIIEFQDSSSSNTTKRTWLYGDGKLTTGRFGINKYDKSGDYLVKLIAENAKGSDTSERLITVSLDSCKTTYLKQDSVINLSGCKGGKVSLNKQGFVFGKPKIMELRLSVPDSHNLVLDILDANINFGNEKNYLTVHSGPHSGARIIGRVSKQSGFVKSYEPLNNGRFLTVKINWQNNSSLGLMLDMRYRCISYKKSKVPDFIPENQNTFSNDFVYPNPTNSILFLDIEAKNENVEFEIYNTSGQQYMSGKYYGSIGIDVSHLAQGVYFIRYTNQLGNNTKLFIKN